VGCPGLLFHIFAPNFPMLSSPARNASSLGDKGSVFQSGKEGTDGRKDRQTRNSYCHTCLLILPIRTVIPVYWYCLFSCTSLALKLYIFVFICVLKICSFCRKQPTQSSHKTVAVYLLWLGMNCRYIPSVLLPFRRRTRALEIRRWMYEWHVMQYVSIM